MVQMFGHVIKNDGFPGLYKGVCILQLAAFLSLMQLLALRRTASPGNLQHDALWRVRDAQVSHDYG